jgi:inhibitor of KinA
MIDTPAEIVRIVPAGDAALVLEFPQRIDAGINSRAAALAGRLQRRCGGAIRDAVVGYASVTVYFDPLIVDAAWMEAEMRLVAADRAEAVAGAGMQIDIPVCYGGEFGPDLADVAAYGGLTGDEVIARHLEATYRVYLVGFVPGFAYMASVDASIAAPRRAAPRPSVPAGSVAIAGPQTGIYPSVTPGGWNIIGRTPVKPYDPSRQNPFLLRTGDTVRFRAVSREAYDRTIVGQAS